MNVAFKKRILAGLIASTFILSCNAGLLTYALDRDSEETIIVNEGISDYGIVLLTDEADYSVRESTAYVSYGKELIVDLSDCDWVQLDTVEIYDKGTQNQYIINSDTDKVVTLAEGEGYRVSFNYKKESGEVGSNVSLKDILSFDSIKIDTEGIIVDSIKIGSKELKDNDFSEKPFLYAFDVGGLADSTDENLQITLGENLSVMAKITINDSIAKYTKDGNTIVVSEEELKNLLVAGTNSINIVLKNKYGTVYEYNMLLALNQLSKVHISDIEYSNPIVLGSQQGSGNIYMQSGTSIKFVAEDIQTIVEGEMTRVSEVLIMCDGEYVESFTDRVENGVQVNYPITREGVYSIEVQYLAYNPMYKSLFEGRKVVFDDTSPNIIDGGIKYSTVISSDDSDDYDNEPELTDEWYNRDGVLRFIVEDDVCLSNNVSILVNGEEFPLLRISTIGVEAKGSGVTKTVYSVNTGYFNKSDDGVYDIEFTVHDAVGNSLTQGCQLKLDSNPPTYLDDEGKNTIAFFDEGIGFDENTLTLVLNDTLYIKDGSYFFDGVSGIKEVLYYRNESDTEAIAEYNNLIQDGNFIVGGNEGSDYVDAEKGIKVDNTGKFVVVDNAGNKIVYTVKDLVSFVYNLDYSNVVVDDEPPKLWISTEPEVGTSRYLDAVPVINCLATDNVGLNRINLYIEGKLYDSVSRNEIVSLEQSYDGGKKVSADFDLNDYGCTDGMYIIRIVVEDLVGGTFEYNGIISIDTAPPENLQVSQIPKPVNEKNGYIYFNEGFDFTLSADDRGSGVREYYLWNDNNSVGSKDGTFSIAEDGNYSVQAIDNVGKSSLKSLKKLLDWSGNNIVIDNEEPSIYAKIMGTPTNNWYREDTTFNIRVEDPKGIDYVEVAVNGEVVDTRKYNDANNIMYVDLAVSTEGIISSDGCYTVTVKAIDNAKLVKKYSKTIYIDKVSPSIDSFVVGGHIKEVDGNYRYFFDGSGSLTIKASDKGGSGISSIFVGMGNNWTEYSMNGGSTLSIEIPEDFKGTIQAYAVDKAGNKGTKKISDGMVSEGSNTHINHSKIIMNLETTNHYDENGNPLYGADTVCNVSVNCDWSGLNVLEWGINNTQLGTMTDFSNAVRWDGNLPLQMDIDVLLSGNSNNMTFWVKVTDNSNRVSEVSQVFGIDADAPSLSVDYNVSYGSGYYSVDRVATITVVDRNFDSGNFIVDGSAGTLGSWSNDGDTWINHMYFDEDKYYGFSLVAVDRAGNTSNKYDSGAFLVDRGKPNVSVSWDNANNRDGYYNSNRTATIKVVEKNFNSSLINVIGANISRWVDNGDVHMATATFSDGVHRLIVNGEDLVGNPFEVEYDSGSFIVDTKNPTIRVDGVSNGTSYKNNVGFAVTIEDDYIDEYSTQVVLRGKNHRQVVLKGVYRDGSGVFSYSDFPKSEDADDVYTLSIYAQDKSGNRLSKEVQFSVNRFGSSYVTENESMMGGYNNKPQNVVISESNVDRINPSNVSVVVTHNGREVVVPSDKVSVEEKEVDGRYYYTYSIDKDQFTDDGKYTVRVYSETEDGDENGSVAEQYDFIVDETKPEVIVSGIKENGVYQEHSKRVTLDIRDLSGIDVIEVFLNGSKVEYTEEDGLYIIDVSESKNAQCLSVRVVDKAGNETIVEVNNFRVSSNVLVYLINQKWFKIVIISVVGLLILLVVIMMIVFIGKKRIKNRSISNGADSSTDETSLLSNDSDEDSTSLMS